MNNLQLNQLVHLPSPYTATVGSMCCGLLHVALVVAASSSQVLSWHMTQKKGAARYLGSLLKHRPDHLMTLHCCTLLRLCDAGDAARAGT
jgi:hypothetical protein